MKAVALFSVGIHQSRFANRIVIEKRLGSRLIAWGTAKLRGANIEHVPSHCALLVGDTVHEAVMFDNIREVPFDAWKERNLIIKMKDIYIDEEFFHRSRAEYWGKQYDFLGLLYFGFCMFSALVFRQPMPCFNKWNRAGKFMCVEWLAMFCGIPQIVAGMMTPFDMMIDLEARR